MYDIPVSSFASVSFENDDRYESIVKMWPNEETVLHEWSIKKNNLHFINLVMVWVHYHSMNIWYRFMKKSLNFFEIIHFILNCICLFRKKNLMINDTNIRRWTFLNRIANIIFLMCIVRILFDKNDNSAEIHQGGELSCAIKIRGWHIWLPIGEACNFPDNDVRPHYAFDDIVLSSEKFVASACIRPITHTMTRLRCMLNSILNQFWTTIDGNDLSRCGKNI